MLDVVERERSVAQQGEIGGLFGRSGSGAHARDFRVQARSVDRHRCVGESRDDDEQLARRQLQARGEGGDAVWIGRAHAAAG